MLEFDEETHTYFWDGEVVPGVNQILEEVGLVQKGFFTPGSAERGKNVHLACQFLDEGDLDWSTVSEECLPYVKGYEKFLKETWFAPALIEERVFNEERYYAGTLDRVGTLKCQNVILDIKTSSQVTKVVGLQLAAYSNCLISNLKQYFKRYALQLTKEGDYKLIPFDDQEDFHAWDSAVTLYHWKKTRRVRKKPQLQAVGDEA